MAASYLGRWDLVQLRCANFMSCTLEERLVLTLLELAENFGIKDKRGVRLTISARHQDLADLVGASRPRVTEFLVKFERDKLINREERHLIINRDRLERLPRSNSFDGYYALGLNDNGRAICSRATPPFIVCLLLLTPVCTTTSCFPHLTDCKRGSSLERNVESATARIPLSQAPQERAPHAIVPPVRRPDCRQSRREAPTELRSSAGLYMLFARLVRVSPRRAAAV